MDEKEPEKEIEKKEDGSNAKQKKFGTWKIFLTGLVFLFALLSFTLYFSLQFLLGNWNELTVDEILYHIKSPMGGAGPHLVQLFLLSVLLPSCFLSIFFQSAGFSRYTFPSAFLFLSSRFAMPGTVFPSEAISFPRSNLLLLSKTIMWILRGFLSIFRRKRET